MTDESLSPEAGDSRGLGAEPSPEQSSPEPSPQLGAEPSPETVRGSRPLRLFRAPHLPRTRRGWRRLYQASAIAVILLFLPITAVDAYAAGYERTEADVPYRPVAIVFGAQVIGKTPSPYLAGRLDVALDLYRRGKVSVILVTGDNSRPDYDEPTAMRDYLVAHGVPASRIVRDFAGFDTWYSCERERKIFGVTSATLVTQDFHLPRALALCRAAGIDAVGVADTSYGRGGEAVHDRAREVAAGFKALIQATLQPTPILGPQEHGVADALRAAGR